MVSEREYEVVREAVALVSRTQSRFARLMRAIAWHPIPFFGSLASARVVTVGLNPSTDEFSASRSWPDQLTTEDLTQRLVGYFHGDVSIAHRWFRPWSESLSLLGASFERDAAHVDLSPRPTRSVRSFREPAERALFLEMLRMDTPVWVSALDAAPHVRLVLLAGSATNEYYINEFIQTELTNYKVNLLPPWKRGAGAGQIAFQELFLPTGRRIPTFFCSSGPSKPDALLRGISANAQRIRHLLDGSPPYI
jgi:hypothetical protein